MLRVIWTNRNVLWVDKFTSNVLNNDEPHLPWCHPQTWSIRNNYTRIHGQHCHCNKNQYCSQGHIVAVTDVLQVMDNHDLYFKPEKCIFHVPSIDYLGVILEERVTHMDPVKVDSVQKWPRPQNVTDVCSFLGFCNFYRIFIPGFAHWAKLLTMLTKKMEEWKQMEEQERTFQDIKQLVTSKPVLVHPKLDKPFELEVDASG